MQARRSDVRWWGLCALLIWSGCLPHSCQRIESRELLPADSVSRALAATVPVDTLARLWTTRDGAGPALSYPRSVQWGANGQSLHLADARGGQIYTFSVAGLLEREQSLPGVDHPYLAGGSQDTLLVLDPEGHRLHYLHEGREVFRTRIVAEEALRRSYVYAARRPDGVVIKTVRADRGARLLFLNEHGVVDAEQELEGPFWRHAGFVRPWGDSLISLCGYRPVLDVIKPDGTIDSLALRGFDSPMLSRSRLFLMDEVDEPPLLYSSAAPAGDLLFVLNLRPGWLRVDVYDRQGHLQRVLREDGSLDQGYYPVDLAVYAAPGGDYEIAVAVAGNRPRLDVYRWSPGIN